MTFTTRPAMSVETCGCGARCEAPAEFLSTHETMRKFRAAHAACRGRQRYTVEQIERMRLAIAQSYHLRHGGLCSNIEALRERIEEELRTYLAAGTTVEELEQHVEGLRAGSPPPPPAPGPPEPPTPPLHRPVS